MNPKKRKRSNFDMSTQFRYQHLLLAGGIIAHLLATGCDFGSSKGSPEPQGPIGPFAVLLTLDGEIPQFAKPNEIFGTPTASQHQFDKTVKKAINDLLVQEVVVHIGSPKISLARASEIVDTLKQIPEANKGLVCHLDSGDNIGYWIAASACPRILLSPAGDISFLGLSLEPLFVRELLASIGVSAEMLHIGAYKDAAETLTRDDMSESSREAALSMIGAIHTILKDGVATGRKIDVDKIQSIIDNGPYPAEKALALKLVDELKPLRTYVEELVAKYPGGVEDEYGRPPPKQLNFTDILKLFGDKKKGTKASASPKIALVPVLGPIMGGKSEELLEGMNSVYDMTLTATLGDLMRDDTIRAVVLRIDSPGGSALASDNIWHAVRALAAKKPVVASMGDVAASGGYYIASAATEVFAAPATLTGSIGVVGGKLVFSEAAVKMGIHSERLETGKRASLNSPFTRFNETERQIITEMMQSAYDLFVNRVVEGRKLTREKVLASAEGRVWTGSQAHERGLVNHLGGITAAVARARVLANVPAGVPLEVVPKPKSFMELMGEALSEPEAKVTRVVAGKHPSLLYGLSVSVLLMRERVLAMAPYLVSAY
jgi:protease IV